MTIIYGDKKSHCARRNLKTQIWDVHEMEDFFAKADLPETLKVSDWEKITNVRNFVNSHLNYVKENNGIITFQPYWERLEHLKNILK